uniref:Uncharacterized protein n=1 Tax=Nelumbo nucifera TaxID=4432 RepID=A0A822YBK9_NELNU|nr:TPA_asm: hypothetical protein HUJ06_028377 [Nelumbo nucifera]
MKFVNLSFPLPLECKTIIPYLDGL